MIRLPVSAIIPAAGSSGRMGSDKALLPYSPGLNFACHLAEAYRSSGAEPVALVVNGQIDRSQLPAESFVCVVNEHTDRGRSWSIRLGIDKIPAGSACFIHNVDNPFADPVLFDAMMQAMDPDGYVVPVCDGRGGHPVLIGSKMVEYLRNTDGAEDFRRTLQKFRRTEILFPDERILWNINTPDDYEKFRKMME